MSCSLFFFTFYKQSFDLPNCYLISNFIIFLLLLLLFLCVCVFFSEKKKNNIYISISTPFFLIVAIWSKFALQLPHPSNIQKSFLFSIVMFLVKSKLFVTFWYSFSCNRLKFQNPNHIFLHLLLQKKRK